MIKVVFKQIVVQAIILTVYTLLGIVLPSQLDIEFPAVTFFSWLIAPVIAVIAALQILKLFKSKVSIYIIISFILNFICILIYTWFESRKPYIKGDFLDFRGLFILFFGWGQIVGIAFTIVWVKVIKKVKIL